MSDTPSTPETPATPIEPAAPVAPPTPAAAPAEGQESLMQNGYYWGTGRRKSAVARVRIRPGQGNFIINKKGIKDFFRVERDQQYIVEPLNAAGVGKNIDVFVNVVGGGTSGQAGAIVLGLARALLKMNPEYIGPLREGHYLTRDSREVERKKYGRAGARRRFQFSKR